MAAYSAVVSLEQLLNQLVNSDYLPKEELVSLHGKISSLQLSLERIFPAPKKERDDANDLAVQIREKIFEAQDTIETFIFTQSNSPQSEETSKSQSSTSISLEELIAKIDPIIEKAKKLGDAIGKDKKEPQPGDESQTNYKSSVSGQSTRIVGQEKYKELLIRKLTSNVTKREVIPICGMPGIGKTTLAKSLFDDAAVKDQFPYRTWVTVSQDYNVGDILAKLLTAIESRGQKPGEKTFQGSEEQLRVQLHQALYNNKYLVVIDDMWDNEVLVKLKLSLPDNENRSRVLLTTRIVDVAKSAVGSNGFRLEMEPLNDEDSWTLLRQKTFGDDNDCPADLENHGRGIAKNCRGLPLSLTVIGGLLSQERKELDYWQSIEEDTYAATKNAKVEESYIEILSLSYDHLPSKLKGCFLYMGAFPEDSDIPVSKLIRLWVAEGFLTMPLPRRPQIFEKVAELSLKERTPPQPPLVEKVAEKSLLELIDRNLVLIRKNRSNGLIKSCGMHDSLRDLAEKESGRDMFFHSRKKYSQKLEDNTNTQRRVSVHKNILICLEEVYNATKLITNARSLIYVGKHHHHPMPFVLAYDLLRVLDAFTVYFIQFPDEFLKLVHLRYLSFTYNGKLPKRLSGLQKLQVLIVKRQPKIIFVGTPFLPDEIWNMKELRHLLITETDLPLLPTSEKATVPGSFLFEKLLTLTNVNAACCTEEVLGNMPNLERLAMWIEAPGKVGLHLNKLDKLEIFKFTVLNPIPGKPIEFQPKLYFPETIRKLNLSGCGLPWKDMEVIAKLPNLEVMKLKELAFHGEVWRPSYAFKILKFLLIEYLNLKKWEAKPSQFPRLEQLYFRHCYDLEGIPSEIGEVGHLKVIELVDCSPEAVDAAEAIKTEQEDYKPNLQVRIYSSWE